MKLYPIAKGFKKPNVKEIIKVPHLFPVQMFQVFIMVSISASK